MLMRINNAPKFQRRRFIVFVIIPVLIALVAFTYVTRDTCYVGAEGNMFGYGSCSQMIDRIIGEGK
jgi:membrane associated rhomboid family serine protease